MREITLFCNIILAICLTYGALQKMKMLQVKSGEMLHCEIRQKSLEWSMKLHKQASFVLIVRKISKAAQTPAF